jgi:anaerobic selenocysteine-containing dehydrogenase
MNPRDAERMGLADGDVVSVATVVADGVERRIDGLRVVVYDIPAGCCGAYYPECNPLLPLWHHAEPAKVPAGKSIPVRIHRIDHRSA